MDPKFLNKDLIILDNDKNPDTSGKSKIYPKSTIDQIFDPKSKDNKSLRQIIEELRYEILTGGRGIIKFPVTSVNGLTEDVVLDKTHIGLDRVDNTQDSEKPLNDIQRTAVNDIIKNYNFQLDLKNLYDHLTDINNPHQITLTKLNQNGELDEAIVRKINSHNLATDTHIDIRRALSNLWNKFDKFKSGIDGNISNTLNSITHHFNDPFAHINEFTKKENIVNKVNDVIIGDSNNKHKYPSVEALIKYVDNKEGNTFNSRLLPLQNWCKLNIVDEVSQLPTPIAELINTIYIIKTGSSSLLEVAICNRRGTDEYFWDIKKLPIYRNFDKRYLIDNGTELTINSANIIDDMFSQNNNIETLLLNHLKAELAILMIDYYKKKEIDDKISSLVSIQKIKLLPGIDDGTIRFYINDDMSTMSEDIRVKSLQRLAFLEWITDNELRENAVHERHILDNSIISRHISSNIVLKGNPKIETDLSPDIDDKSIPNVGWIKNNLSGGGGVGPRGPKGDKGEKGDPGPKGRDSDITRYDVESMLRDKQDILTAGNNIKIENNVISSTGGSTLQAGDGLRIENNTISSVLPILRTGNGISVENGTISSTITAPEFSEPLFPSPVRNIECLYLPISFGYSKLIYYFYIPKGAGIDEIYVVMNNKRPPDSVNDGTIFEKIVLDDSYKVMPERTKEILNGGEIDVANDSVKGYEGVINNLSDAFNQGHLQFYLQVFTYNKTSKVYNYVYNDYQYFYLEHYRITRDRDYFKFDRIDNGATFDLKFKYNDKKLKLLDRYEYRFRDISKTRIYFFARDTSDNSDIFSNKEGLLKGLNKNKTYDIYYTDNKEGIDDHNIIFMSQI